jgi:hypothetical protein
MPDFATMLALWLRGGLSIAFANLFGIIVVALSLFFFLFFVFVFAVVVEDAFFQHIAIMLLCEKTLLNPPTS